MLLSLISFDTRSLLGILIWGNVATGIIINLYQLLNEYKDDTTKMRSMTIIRFLYAVGYILLFFRGHFNDILSVNIGNTLLFICHYCEARIMMELAGVAGKRINTVLLSIFTIDVIIFNLVEFNSKDSALRVGMASIIIFSLYLLPTVRIMASKAVSNFKRAVSVFYIFLLIALASRGTEAFVNINITLLSNNYAQTVFFMSLILLMVSNTIVYLMFMKEQVDIIIEEMATTDNLTNTLNRHSFFTKGRQVFESHKSSKIELAILFFDIDYFKKINDNYGHQLGDMVLTHFADIVKNNIRPNDLCGRYGGEEFVVLLSRANENISVNVATRIMKEIEKYTVDVDKDFNVTTSVGIVSAIPKAGELLEDYIQKADEALYQAKRGGRNRFVVYSIENNLC